jgi:hypothetical protein
VADQVLRRPVSGESRLGQTPLGNLANANSHSRCARSRLSRKGDRYILIFSSVSLSWCRRRISYKRSDMCNTPYCTIARVPADSLGGPGAGGLPVPPGRG